LVYLIFLKQRPSRNQNWDYWKCDPGEKLMVTKKGHSLYPLKKLYSSKPLPNRGWGLSIFDKDPRLPVVDASR
jgi:hypothetical protein